MVNKRVICPDCAHRFTVQIGGQQTKTIGVRAHRLTGNQFEYTVTMPSAMTDNGRVTTVTDDLILTSAFSLPVGAAAGLLASIAAPNYAIELIGLGASTGTILAVGWLCAEHNQRLKRILPWFVEKKEAWAAARDEGIGGNVSLTMDHRYRDGYTESGRTIQYFGELPVDIERFNQWAEAILGTRVPAQTLAIANWTGSKGLFSRKEYDSLLALLRKSQAVILRGGEGHILTGGGRRALRQHLKAQPPTPAGGMHDG
jgi:hypothetical protein